MTNFRMTNLKNLRMGNQKPYEGGQNVKLAVANEDGNANCMLNVVFHNIRQSN